MLLEFLIGYALIGIIGAILEVCIEIASYNNAKAEIKHKAQASIGNQKDIFEMFVASQEKYVDGETLVLKAFDRNKNHIANVKVKAPQGTPLRVGERF
ncbi:MAG: hypothetical protein IJ634_06245 [Bacteroidales bacterium]|nr:hypothetical protein [Bacteroidales bacterium]